MKVLMLVILVGVRNSVFKGKFHDHLDDFNELACDKPIPETALLDTSDSST